MLLLCWPVFTHEKQAQASNLRVRFINAFKWGKHKIHIVKVYQDLSGINIKVQYKDNLNISLGKVEFSVQKPKKVRYLLNFELN